MTTTLEQINQDFYLFLEDELNLLLNRNERYESKNDFDAVVKLAKTFKLKNIDFSVKKFLHKEKTIYYGLFVVTFELNGQDFTIECKEDRISPSAGRLRFNPVFELLQSFNQAEYKNVLDYQKEYAEGLGLSMFSSGFKDEIAVITNQSKTVVNEFWHLLNKYNLYRHIQEMYDYSLFTFLNEELRTHREKLTLNRDIKIGIFFSALSNYAPVFVYKTNLGKSTNNLIIESYSFNVNEHSILPYDFTPNDFSVVNNYGYVTNKERLLNPRVFLRMSDSKKIKENLFLDALMESGENLLLNELLQSEETPSQDEHSLLVRQIKAQINALVKEKRLSSDEKDILKTQAAINLLAENLSANNALKESLKTKLEEKKQQTKSELKQHISDNHLFRDFD